MNKLSVSRRNVLLTAAVAPLIISSRAWGSNSRIRVGQIGCGRIAQGHDMPGVIKSELADFVAICELDARRLADGVKIIEKSYTDRGMTPPQIRTFDNYRELIARKDIDAVVISTPDHWHAEVALAAIESGKDVYLQKPFTMTHAEGVILRDAVKRHGRILQVGSQQRSWEQFRRAAELIRSGRIGNVQRVEIGSAHRPHRAGCATHRDSREPRFRTVVRPDAVQVLHRDARASAGGLQPAGLAASRGALPGDDHGLGLASLRHHALGAAVREHRSEQGRRQG